MTPIVGLLLMSLIWGLTWLPTKWATEVVPPIFLAAVRFGLAGLMFLALSAALRIPLRPSRPGRVLLASLFISTLAFSFLFWGAARAPTGLAGTVNLSLMPLFLMLLGAAHGQEALTRRRLLAVAVGITGLVLLFSTRRGGSPGEAREVALGLGAIAVGTLFYAWGR